MTEMINPADINDRPAKDSGEVYFNIVKTAVQFVLDMAQYQPFCRINGLGYNNCVHPYSGRVTSVYYNSLYSLVQKEIEDYFPHMSDEELMSALKELISENKIVTMWENEEIWQNAFYPR